MFVKVTDILAGMPCKIAGFAHTELSDDSRFQRLTQAEFIKHIMSHDGRLDLMGAGPWSDERIEEAADRWAEVAPEQRVFFSGSTAELGAIAAQKCLANAGVSAAEIDMIVGGTNTGPGYPSLADHIKAAIGPQSDAGALDCTEACTVGAIAPFVGWNMIRSGACQKVLVVCAERATTLTSYDNWKGSNLFGDAAFAFLLSSAEAESFLFWDFQSLPHAGGLDKIKRTDAGFFQDGNSVHKFVGREVVKAVVAALEKAGIDPSAVDHVVPHQPSIKTVDLLEGNLRRSMPGLKAVIHRNVDDTGNTSGATTGLLISRAVHAGQIKSGQLIMVIVFGGGLSIGTYAFRMAAI